MNRDLTTVRQHLESLCKPWSDIEAPTRMEIRCLKEGCPSISQIFDPHDENALHNAISKADRNNQAGYNVYVCVNPIKEGTSGSASDSDIVAACFCFADADNDGDAERLRDSDKTPHGFEVITGQIPHLRIHAYWQLEEPCLNLIAWTSMQKAIAQHHGTDSSICNPSRIMRLAGFVSHPSEAKQLKRYVVEHTSMSLLEGVLTTVAFETLMVEYPDVPVVEGAQPTETAAFDIDLGHQAMDRAQAESDIMAGKNWHNNVIRLVASYISKGMSDSDIHALTDRFTIPPFTVENTRREVQKSINRARKKGFGKSAALNAGSPQPLIRTVSKAAPYPIDALGPLKEAVIAIQGQTLAPVAIAAQSALSVASLAVQGFADVETLGGTRPISLYCLTIASSGERKSSCDAPLMEAVAEYEQVKAQEHRELTLFWKTQHALWKLDHDAIMNSAKKKNGRTAAEADLNALGEEPAAPPSPDRIVTNPTYQGLTRQFKEGEPSLGIFSDEGGQFLGGYSMTGENRQHTLAALNDAWQGKPIKRTLQGEGSYTLFGKRLAIHLMVQPGVAITFMADPASVDTGFLPRFLICKPVSTIGTRMHANMQFDYLAISSFKQRLSARLNTPLPMDEEMRELTPRELPLSKSARDLLIAYADMIEREQGKGRDLEYVKGYASKSAEQACRIAGVLALWGDLGAADVSQGDMKNAIDLAQYYLLEALRLSDEAAISVKTDAAEKLRVWLQETWSDNEILLSDVLQKGPHPSLRERSSALEAVNTLIDAGWLIGLPDGSIVRGKKRKHAFSVVRVS